MANIPKRLVFSTLIAFSMILLSQEKIFADDCPPTESASAGSQPQGRDATELKLDSDQKTGPPDILMGDPFGSGLQITPTDTEEWRKSQEEMRRAYEESQKPENRAKDAREMAEKEREWAKEYREEAERDRKTAEEHRKYAERGHDRVARGFIYEGATADSYDHSAGRYEEDARTAEGRAQAADERAQEADRQAQEAERQAKESGSGTAALDTWL